MRALRALSALPLLFLAACGDDSPADVDAPTAIDAADDAAAPDAPEQAGCDYSEQRDLTNDDVSDPPGTPEDTGLTFTSKTVVCGTFESSHFDNDITVDIDGYILTVAADSDVLIRLHGAGISGPELVGVDVYGGATLSTLVGSNSVIGTHAVTALRLPAGRYELVPFVLNAAAITSSLPYKLEVSVDTPATRCPEVTTGGFAEVSDGGANTGNDMVRIPSGSPPALTISPADMPEQTALILAAGVNTRVTGSAADVAVADQYEDVDTYLIETAVGVTELAVRLTWPGTTTNLDFILFEPGNADPVLRAISTGGTAPELRTFGVKAGQPYWLLVGAKSGTGNLPAAYTASLCGASFTP